VLLAIWFVSGIYPLLDISHWFRLNPVLQEAAATSIQYLPEFTTDSYSMAIGVKSVSVEIILLGLYALIAGFYLIRMVIRIAGIIRLRLCCNPIEINGTKVYCLKDQSNPFSFFNLIFINPDSCTPVEIREITTHELVHVRQYHSIDILLAELTCVLCWFNPLAWMLKNEIHRNLEFLVDNRVIGSGIDSRSYQFNLLRLANVPSNIFITNQFITSSLKERIIMLHTKPSSAGKLIVYAIFLPLVFLFLMANHIGATDDSADLSGKGTNELTGETFFLENIGEVFRTVDEAPTFPGGIVELNQFLMKNIRYPDEFMEKGIQGRVVCSFIVDSNGTITNVEIVSGLDPLLDNETLRVIYAMPRWNPGKHQGVAVPVQMNIPVTFRLQ
jgi:TonB family protein